LSIEGVAIETVPDELAEAAAPLADEEPRAPIFTVNNVFRLLVLVALAVFLLYYVGPRDIAETTVKVLFAVGLTAALWIGANLLFDQAYSHWTRFNALLGATLGFLVFFVRRRPICWRTPCRVTASHLQAWPERAPSQC